jgi:hypothetical protein
MSYNVTANGRTVETTSYDAAKTAIKSAAVEFAAKLAQPVRPGLFKSFKATKRINADRVRSAEKLTAGVKLPKTAGDVAGNVGGFAFAIARK